MARSDIPDALQMKVLKYGDRPDEERDRIAARLREAGRRSEAVLLFEGRPDHPFLQEEKRWAVEEGCAFHLLSLRRLGVPVADDDLRVCGQTAERRGRWLDARQCWAALEDEEGLQRIAPHVPEGLRPEIEEEGTSEVTAES
jgi:hypothetical protein